MDSFLLTLHLLLMLLHHDRKMISWEEHFLYFLISHLAVAAICSERQPIKAHYFIVSFQEIHGLIPFFFNEFLHGTLPVEGRLILGPSSVISSEVVIIISIRYLRNRCIFFH